jgi:hypothetical protein
MQTTPPEYPMMQFSPWQQPQNPYVQQNPFSQMQMPQMPPIAPPHQMYQQQLFQAMNPMYQNQTGYYQQQSMMPDRIFTQPGFPPMPRPVDPIRGQLPAPRPAGPAVTLSADATAFRNNLLRQAADPDLLEKAVANEKRMLADKLAEEESAKAAATAREVEERLKTEKEAAATKTGKSPRTGACAKGRIFQSKPTSFQCLRTRQGPATRRQPPEWQS